MKSIAKERFDKAIKYEDYRDMVYSMAESEKTTGEQDQARIDFTKLNAQRMKRVEKTTLIDSGLSARLKAVGPGLKFLILSESWCGDASQNVPVMAKMGAACNCVDVRILLRDENLDIMDQFLTNGGRAIPKLLLLDDDCNVIGEWGPRPKVIQDRVMANKTTGEFTKEEMDREVQLWYAKDRGTSLQLELVEMLESALINNS